MARFIALFQIPRNADVLARLKCADLLPIIWLALIALTGLSLLMAESRSPGYVTTLLICAIVLIKGHWVIHYFMGLGEGPRLRRWLVTAYVYAVLVAIVVSEYF